MIDQIAQSNYTDAEQHFHSLMNDKVADALASEKEQLAKSLFNSKTED